MVQTEPPLYPKLSPIYNKIMQLVIAIALIIVVMNILIFNDNRTKATINQQFITISQDYTQNVANTIGILLTANTSFSRNKYLKKYLQNLPKDTFIHDVRFYDKTGQLKVASEHSQSIKDLYGINKHKVNRSDELIPFVSEVRTGKKNQLQGYLRLTIQKSYLIAPLLANEQDNRQFIRLMLILAGAIGFLLTRGLNRFSRQGYRVVRT